LKRLERTLDELNGLIHRGAQIHEMHTRLLPLLEFHGMVGKSPAMLELIQQAQTIARHYSNVLVTGPTGSGKELVAKALHEMSPVAQMKFAVCNSSALVETLLESQLFGHVRGAFTGATDTRPGLFEFANGGTVFLDEIGELSPQLQAKLLRVAQNREIQRVGSPEVKTVNVRLIAATHRDLRDEVAAGRFREDLYYRLSAVEIRVPSLAERMDDLPVLMQFFLKKCNQTYGKELKGFTRRAQIAMARHRWPGNIRELDNVVASAAMLAQQTFIDLCDLPAHLQAPETAQTRIDAPGWQPLPLAEIRRMHVERVLEVCNGNRVRAAEMLGIGRTSLYRMLKRRNGSRRASPDSTTKPRQRGVPA
jgi:transcriptional regulator with PAS, ATPase and Fis domain